MAITQFKGESREQAIINHFSLDVKEEDRFLKFIRDMGYTVNSDDETIESLHEMWNNKLNK